MGAVFFCFTTPIGALSDSLAQRRANHLGVSFGTIRTWGSIGFATSALIIGELLARIGIQYMIIPYLLFGTMALLVVFKLTALKVQSDPIQLTNGKVIIH